VQKGSSIEKDSENNDYIIYKINVPLAETELYTLVDTSLSLQLTDLYG
jgi:hypothetical protein